MPLSISDAVRAKMAPGAASLEPYDAEYSWVEVNLSANENTHPMPAAVHAAVDAALAMTPLNRYPQPLAPELRAELAYWHRVTKFQVIVGNGGDELIFNLLLAFGGIGKKLAICTPTFSVYGIYARLLGTEVIEVPLDASTFAIDEEALLAAAAEADLVFLCSPNNPTGNLVPTKLVSQVCAACSGIVLLDEAYIEFADEGMSSEVLLATFDNLVVLHTLSKAFSMAGCRIGYALSTPDIVNALSAVRQPYSVNVLSQAAALVVARSRDSFKQTIATIRSEREKLARDLSAIEGVSVWPSQANFLLISVPGKTSKIAWRRLRDEYSILVRCFASTPGLEKCLRVTVGTSGENKRLVSALEHITKE